MDHVELAAMSPHRPSKMTHTGAYGFSIHVAPAGLGGRESAISVERELGSFGLVGMVLKSSDRQAPLIAGERWPDGVRLSTDDRLRRDGAKKGRVLAVWQGQQVMAVCSWHLHESGPAVIFDLAVRNDVSRGIAALTREALLLCLRDIAGARGLNRDTLSLRWADRALDHLATDAQLRNRLRGLIRARAADLDFKPLRPRPKWLKSGWVSERRFD